MEKKMNNEELQNRREFFKKAAKGALPILGAIVFAATPFKALAKTSTGCDYACVAECGYACQGCWTGCTGTCKSCANGCASGCTGGCKGYCGGKCSMNCAGGCKGGCGWSANDPGNGW